MKLSNQLITFSIAACLLTACQSSDSSNSSDATNSDTDSTVVAENPINEAPFTYGIDISKYQGDEITLIDKSKDSLSFIICRSGEGNTYTDPKFDDNWKMIAEKGFIRGAYHFYLSDDDSQIQANHFLGLIKDLAPTDLPPIVDFEELSINKETPKDQVRDRLLEFLKIIEDSTSRVPMIYTDINIGNSYLSDAAFAKYPLWVANYTTNDEPSMPGAWKGSKWLLWQKTFKYKIGNTGNDFDIFNGSVTQMKDWIKATN